MGFGGGRGDALMSQGSISVIILSHNHGAFLREAVDSVLAQSRLPESLLISDDASTDDSFRIAEEYQGLHPGRISARRNAVSRGAAPHLNLALSLTAAEYVCVVAADNRLRPDFLQRCAAALEADPQAGVAYSDCALFGPRAEEAYRQFPRERQGGIAAGGFYTVSFPDIGAESAPCLAGALFRRSAWERCGGCVIEPGVPEDYGLYRRMVRGGWRAVRVAAALFECRQLPSRDERAVACENGAPLPRVFGMVTTRPSAQYTVSALSSFFRFSELRDGDQFYLIDNDRSLNLEAVRRAYPQVTVVLNPERYSFSANANQILALADRRGADAFFMNNDLVFTPGWLRALSARPFAIMTPTCNQYFQYRAGEFSLKAVMTLEDLAGHEAEFFALALEHARTHAAYASAYRTPFFCVKIPREVYQTVGALETGFGMAGGEDDDYCLRCHLAGAGVVVAEQSYLLHFGGRSTWSGVETPEEWSAREKGFAACFRQKWGRTAARFVLYRDPSLIAADPVLAAAEKRGIGELVRTMCARDGVPVPAVRIEA